jgi:hypothetical protein
LANIDLKQYARRGAEARIAELTDELDAIYRAFPELRKTRAARLTSARTAAAPTSAPTRRRRRRAMTAAQKREVSLRMKKYWAARKKAESKAEGK